MISTAPPFVLRLSKDERRVFQQNPDSCLTLWAVTEGEEKALDTLISDG